MKNWIEQLTKKITNDFTYIVLFFSLIIALILSIIGLFPSIKIPNNIYLPIIFFIGSSSCLLLIEIRSLIRAKKNISHFDNMNEVQQLFFDKLIEHIKKKDEGNVTLRLYGFRCTNISNILFQFMNFYKKNKIVARKLDIYIYHCAPEFLENAKPHNLDEDEQRRIHTLYKNQAEGIEQCMKTLKNMSDTNQSIKIYFRKYFSIPNFWAFEIDSEDVIWGYFTWDKEVGNWIGPENSCIYFNKNTQPINGFSDWVNSQFLGLESWSISYEPKFGS